MGSDGLQFIDLKGGNFKFDKKVYQNFVCFRIIIWYENPKKFTIGTIYFLFLHLREFFFHTLKIMVFPFRKRHILILS